MPDLESRAAVANYTRITFGGLRTVNCGWLTLHGVGKAAVSDDMRPSEWRALRAAGHVVRRPDVMVCGTPDFCEGRVAVIEADGSIHVKKSERTYRRNYEYFMHGIPYLILTDEEVSNGDAWKDKVDAFVLDAFPEAAQ